MPHSKDDIIRATTWLDGVEHFGFLALPLGELALSVSGLSYMQGQPRGDLKSIKVIQSLPDQLGADLQPLSGSTQVKCVHHAMQWVQPMNAATNYETAGFVMGGVLVTYAILQRCLSQQTLCRLLSNLIFSKETRTAVKAHLCDVPRLF